MGQELIISDLHSREICVNTYVKDARELVLGELDTAADGGADGSEDLLNLVASLDVAD